jgi:aldehyde:ferredoxin oxidoreductase
MINSIGLCAMLPYTPPQVANIVHAITGWDTSTTELLQVGRRILTMARIYNLREGFTAQDDWLPPRFFMPTTSGALAKTAIDPDQLRTGIKLYYEFMGWHKGTGVPHVTSLIQLNLDWLTQQPSKTTRR